MSKTFCLLVAELMLAITCCERHVSCQWLQDIMLLCHVEGADKYLSLTFLLQAYGSRMQIGQILQRMRERWTSWASLGCRKQLRCA